MLIASGRTAATLTAAIDAVNVQIVSVTAAIANGAFIAGGNLIVNDPIAYYATSNINQLTLNQLTVAESATVFNSMLTILNARLATWNAALAALS